MREWESKVSDGTLLRLTSTLPPQHTSCHRWHGYVLAMASEIDSARVILVSFDRVDKFLPQAVVAFCIYYFGGFASGYENNHSYSL
jgi:hypothetical protein